MTAAGVERILTAAGFAKAFREDEGFVITALEGKVQVWHYPDVSQKMLKVYQRALKDKCTVQRLRTHLVVS